MIARVLKIVAALALVSLPAQAEEPASINGMLGEIVRAVHEAGPYRDWDTLRMAAPRSVRWHLAPPDRGGARAFRRSGWVEADGRQAGIAACGSANGPELMALRRAGGDYQGGDPVIEALREQMNVRQIEHEPTMVGEIDRFEIGELAARLTRVLDCPLEGARDVQPCVTNYTLDIRPTYRGAPVVTECHAP